MVNGNKGINLHVVLNNFKNDTRVLKETKSIAQFGLFDSIQIVALWEQGVDEHESLDPFRRVWRVPLRTRGLPKDLLSQFIKYLECLFRVFLAYRNKNVAVTHCHDLAALPFGLIFKLFCGSKIIYDAHEFETEQEENPGKLHYFLSVRAESFLVRFADKVICVSNSIAQEYAKRYKIPCPNLVLNCPPYQSIEHNNIFRESLGILVDVKIYLYQGGLFAGRGIEQTIEAFKLLHDEKRAVVFMGYGPLENMIIDATRRYSNIYFHEAVNPDVLLKYTSSADYGMLFIPNSCLSYYYCLPNKVFEYIMAGLPLIISDLFEVSALVRNSHIGIVTKDITAKGIYDAILNSDQLDRTEVESKLKNLSHVYNWQSQEQILLNIYSCI